MTNTIDFLVACAGGNLKVPVDEAGSMILRRAPSTANNNVRTIYRPHSMIAFEPARSSTKKPKTIIDRIVEACTGNGTRKRVEERTLERQSKASKICHDYGLNAATWREYEENQDSIRCLAVSRITVLIDILIEACAGTATKKRVERESFKRKWKLSNHLVETEDRNLSSANFGPPNMVAGVGKKGSGMYDYSDQFPGAEWEEALTSTAASSCCGTTQANLHSMESDVQQHQVNPSSTNFNTAPSQLADLDLCVNTHLYRSKFTTNRVVDEMTIFRLLPKRQTPKPFPSPCTRVQDIYFPQGSPIHDAAALANESYIRDHVNTQKAEDSGLNPEANNTKSQDEEKQQKSVPKSLAESQNNQGWFIRVTKGSLEILKSPAKSGSAVQAGTNDVVEDSTAEVVE